MLKLSDKELIKSYLKGNQEHSTLIVKRYSRYVFSIIRSMIRDHKVFEDLQQAVFLNVFRGLDAFRWDWVPLNIL